MTQYTYDAVIETTTIRRMTVQEERWNEALKDVEGDLAYNERIIEFKRGDLNAEKTSKIE